jgi:hypothetical protein
MTADVPLRKLHDAGVVLLQQQHNTGVMQLT